MIIVKKQILSLFLIIVMIFGLLGSVTGTAKAATAPFYYSCLELPAKDADCVNNGADTASVSLKLSDTLSLSGWVLSTLQFTSYTVYLSKGSNPPSKTVEATRGTYPFPTNFVSDVQKATGKKYTTQSSLWKADIALSNLSAGTWTVMVKGRVEGDKDSLYDIAKITVNITDAGAGNYAVCNDKPNPNSIKQYSVNASNKITIPNYYVYGNTKTFDVDGWAIHDRGIASYSYSIKNKSTGNVVKSGTLKAYNRTDLGPTAQNLQIAVNNCTKNTGYNGSISIENLNGGDYIAYITGKTQNGQTFAVCDITFKIQGTVTAKDGSNVVTKYTAPEKGGSKTFTIVAKGGSWSATSNSSWIKLSPDKTNNTLKLTIDANKGTAARTGKVTIRTKTEGRVLVQ